MSVKEGQIWKDRDKRRIRTVRVLKIYEWPVEGEEPLIKISYVCVQSRVRAAVEKADFLKRFVSEDSLKEIA